MAEIVWLASYPKSGNTWVRFLLGYARDAEAATKRLDAIVGQHAATRVLFDTFAGFKSSAR